MKKKLKLQRCDVISRSASGHSVIFIRVASRRFWRSWRGGMSFGVIRPFAYSAEEGLGGRRNRFGGMFLREVKYDRVVVVEVRRGNPLHVLITVTLPSHKVLEGPMVSPGIDDIRNLVGLFVGGVRWRAGVAWAARERIGQGVWDQTIDVENVVYVAISDL